MEHPGTSQLAPTSAPVVPPGPDLCGAPQSHQPASASIPAAPPKSTLHGMPWDIPLPACACFSSTSPTRALSVWSVLGPPLPPPACAYLPTSTLAIPPGKTWCRVPTEPQLIPAIATASQPKLTGTHSLHRRCSYTRPLLQD